MKSLTIFSCLTILVLAACGDDETTTPGTDFSANLENIGNQVIVPTYNDLAAKALSLQTATATLEANPTAANLDAAKNAWVATRSPWEQSEGFLFGPVDQEGIDPSIDSWPVNVTDLNNVLASSDALTVEFLAAQEGTLKGFHTIEYLLWGENGGKQVADFTAREFEYLAACAGALAADTERLHDLWSPSGGNYIRNLTAAGESSSIYISQKAALEEIANAMVVIADEVGNGKINDPYTQQDLSLEESRFSANSKADFADNIRSMRNIYLGQWTNNDGAGISDVVKAENATLDTEILAAIDAAIAAIEGIPGTFSEAVFDNPTTVGNAQQKVRDLQGLLESELLPLISNL